LPSQIKLYETGAINAQTVPSLLINCMIIFSAILLVQGLAAKEKTEYEISGKMLTKESLIKLKPAIYIAMLLVYAIIMPKIGFIISSLLLSNGVLLYFGTRKWYYYLIVSANVFVVYFAFQALNVYLP